MLAAVWAGAPWFSLLAAVAASLGVLEFYRLAEEREARPEVVLGIGWTLFLIISGHLGGSLTMWALLGGGAAAFAWHQLGRLRSLWGAPPLGFRDAMRDYGYTAAGAIYLGLPLSLALVLRAEVQGLEWILIVLLGTFATDTGAFFTGRAIGRRPLAPSISPGKTQEGAVGGFLAGVGAVMAWLHCSTFHCLFRSRLCLGRWLPWPARSATLWSRRSSGQPARRTRAGLSRATAEF